MIQKDINATYFSSNKIGELCPDVHSFLVNGAPQWYQYKNETCSQIRSFFSSHNRGLPPPQPRVALSALHCGSLVKEK